MSPRLAVFTKNRTKPAYEAARLGADVATMPYDVFTKLVKHPLTDLGLAKFDADWKKLQQELEKGA